MLTEGAIDQAFGEEDQQRNELNAGKGSVGECDWNPRGCQAGKSEANTR